MTADRVDAAGLESLDEQINRLARFIGEQIPGEPSQSQGAIDTAIRLLADCHGVDAAAYLSEQP